MTYRRCGMPRRPQPADRQQVIRFLVERVEVEIEGISDRVRVTITWAGGQQTRHEVIRPVGRYEQTADFDRLMARIGELRAAGMSFARIAECLNAEGYRPAKGAAQFDGDMVGRLLRHLRSELEVASEGPQGNAGGG